MRYFNAALCLLFVLARTQDSTDFYDALVQAASVATEQIVGNISNPVPLDLPLNITRNREINRLAALMPALPVNVGIADPQDILSDITPPVSNDSEGQMEKRQRALRVLVVGNSMSHCNEGDYTWRYRFWQWLSGYTYMEYVGPYIGTLAKDAPAPPSPPALYGSKPQTGTINTSGGYAPGANFKRQVSNHFAVNGRAAAVDKGLIQDVVANYPADLMLVMLGFNDLGWFYSDDKGLLDSMATLVQNARKSNPNLMIVIGTVPQRTFIAGRNDLPQNTDSYNRMLKNACSSWSTSNSPVVIAPVQGEYNCGPKYTNNCTAAYDGLHPNELGEYQIARAFSRALVTGLGIGSSPLSVPSSISGRALPVPSNFRLSSSPQGVTGTWDKIYGAYDYEIDYRINGNGPYKFSAGSVPTNRWDSRWAVDGWSYEVRVRARAGNGKVGDWTGWLTATAHPQTAPGPSNITLRATATGVDISWTPPTGQYTDSIVEYGVYYWDLDANCAILLLAAFRGTSAHIDDLIPGNRHLIAIETWNANAAGFPAIARRIVPGRGTPGVPANLQVSAPDASTAHLTWNAVAGAGGYQLWRRDINQQGSQLSRNGLENTILRACSEVYYQVPGAWNYEWAVSAINGEAEGGKSSSKVAPHPQDGATIAACPADPGGFCNPGAVGGYNPGNAVVDKDTEPVGGYPSGGSVGGGNVFHFAAIGDSYGSGVTYQVRGDTDYDKNAEGCLRINHAYSVQLMNDFPNVQAAPVLHFVACSGSVMAEIVGGTRDGKKMQMGKIGPSNKFISMHISGNDVNFYAIAMNCIFQVSPFHDYGGTYPADGECKDAINAARRTITSDASDGLFNRLKGTILDLYNQPNAKNIQKLYVLSYPRFFNADTDFCSGESISPIPYRKSATKLTKALRNDINALSVAFTQRIEQVINSFEDRSRLTFLNVDPGFEGHRFCEPGQDKDWLFNRNDDVWIWSATTKGLIVSGNQLANPADNDDARQRDVDDKYRITYNTTGQAADDAAKSFNWTDTLRFDKDPATLQNPIVGLTGGEGSQFRPFHPTQAGHRAIKEILYKQVQQDFGGAIGAPAGSK